MFRENKNSIKLVREKKGYTSKELAKKLDDTAQIEIISFIYKHIINF